MKTGLFCFLASFPVFSKPRSGVGRFAGTLALDGKWQKLDQIRILMGDEVTKRTHRALAEGFARVGQLMDDSIEREKQKNDFLTGVDQIVQAIASGKTQCRVYSYDRYRKQGAYRPPEGLFCGLLAGTGA